jgi:hypothetical protein
MQNDVGTSDLSREKYESPEERAAKSSRLCRLFIPEAMEGLLQTLDETRLLLTPSHVAPPFLCLHPVLMPAVEIGRTETAKNW